MVIKYFKILLLLIGSFSLVGCFASEQGYKDIVYSWIGQKETELVRAWGPPDSTYEVKGMKYLTYNSNRNIFIPGATPTYTTTVIGNTAYTNSYGGYSSMNIAKKCKTTFEIKKLKSFNSITAVKYSGNDCKAKGA